MAHLLLVDDDSELLPEMVRHVFPAPRNRVEIAHSGEMGLECIRAKLPDVVLLDLRLPDQSGLDILKQIRAADARIPVVLITASRSAGSAIEAMRQGAYDYLLKHDTSAAHGEPLGEEEIRLTKQNYGWPEDAKFYVPNGVYDHLRNHIGKRGKELRDAWFSRVSDYRAKFPDLADQLYRMQHRQLPEGWDKDMPTFAADAKGMGTRESSGKVLNSLAKRVPWLLGGSADLAPSTKTRLTFDGAGDFLADDSTGRNFHFSIRKFYADARKLEQYAQARVSQKVTSR